MSLDNLRRTIPDKVVLENIEFNIKLEPVPIHIDPYSDQLVITFRSIDNQYGYTEHISTLKAEIPGTVEALFTEICKDLQYKITTPTFEL